MKNVKNFARKLLTVLVTAFVFGFVVQSFTQYRKLSPLYKSLLENNFVGAYSAKQPIHKVYRPSPSGAPEIAGLKLLYYETFDDTLLNPAVWSAVLQNSIENEELQVYHPSQVCVADGRLNLIASCNTYGGYTSGKIDTKDKLELIYGRIDISMKLCAGTGLFPAIWLLYEDTKKNTYFEIDIMENLGQEPETIYGVVHMTTATENIRDFSTYTIDNPQAFHVYSVQWTSDGIVWYVDGNEFFRITARIPAVPMYLIMNLAVGGEWAGDPDGNTVFPAVAQVEYVRFYTYEDAA